MQSHFPFPNYIHSSCLFSAAIHYFPGSIFDFSKTSIDSTEFDLCERGKEGSGEEKLQGDGLLELGSLKY